MPVITTSTYFANYDHSPQSHVLPVLKESHTGRIAPIPIDLIQPTVS